MYLLPIFLFVLGAVAIWLVSGIIYRNNAFGKTATSERIPVLEKILYYFVAAYPPLSYIALKLSGDYLFPGSSIFDEPTRRQFIIYTGSHLLLCLMSLSVVRYLMKRHRANIIFALAGSITGGLYFAILMVTFIVTG